MPQAFLTSSVKSSITKISILIGYFIDLPYLPPKLFGHHRTFVLSKISSTVPLRSF